MTFHVPRAAVGRTAARLVSSCAGVFVVALVIGLYVASIHASGFTPLHSNGFAAIARKVAVDPHTLGSDTALAVGRGRLVDRRGPMPPSPFLLMMVGGRMRSISDTSVVELRLRGDPAWESAVRSP